MNAVSLTAALKEEAVRLGFELVGAAPVVMSPDFDRFEPLWGRERIAKLKKDAIQTPLIDISSTEVRKRLAAGEDVRGMLHPDVIDYIQRHGLYR